MSSIRDKILNALDNNKKVDEKGHLLRKKKRKKYLYIKEEIDAFLKLYNIQSRYKYQIIIETLAREDKSYPSRGNIIKYYKNWEEIRIQVFNKNPISEITPPEIIQVLIKFNINNVRSLMKLKKNYPDILPGFNSILKMFGSYKILFKLKKTLSLKDNAEIYLKLLDRLKRNPTYNECIEAGIDLNRMVKVFGNRKEFDIFMHKIKKIKDTLI